MWDVDTGKEVRRLTGHPSAISSVVYSPDGRTAASAGKKGVLILWDVETGKEIRHLKGYEGDALDESNTWAYVRFSPDGQTLAATTYNGMIVLWDIVSGKEIRHFEGQSVDVRSFTFSNDGQRAFSGSSDTTAILWDVANGSILHRFRDHNGPIFRADMTSDGYFGIAGSSDGTTILWDLRTSEIIRRYYAGPYTTLFAPDNRTALVGSLSSDLELWRMDLTLDDLVTWIYGNRYVPELTCEQRTLYRLDPLCGKDATQVPTGAR